MNSRRTTRVLGFMAVLLLAAATPALADSHGAHAKGTGPEKSTAPGKSGTGPSAEDRVKMAEAYEKLAACLRSTQPIEECRSEMKATHAAWGHGKSCSGGKGCSHDKACAGGKSCPHGESCPHGKDCPHGEACPHGDACDGSCKHHRHQGGHHGRQDGDAHGEMCENGKSKSKGDKAPAAVPSAPTTSSPAQ